MPIRGPRSWTFKRSPDAAAGIPIKTNLPDLALTNTPSEQSFKILANSLRRFWDKKWTSSIIIKEAPLPAATPCAVVKIVW